MRACMIIIIEDFLLFSYDHYCVMDATAMIIRSVHRIRYEKNCKNISCVMIITKFLWLDLAVLIVPAVIVWFKSTCNIGLSACVIIAQKR